MKKEIPVIETEDLEGRFYQGQLYKKSVVYAVNGVSLKLYQGETLGLVGETGCGKSTFCRLIMRLYQPTSGKILFNGDDVAFKKEGGLRELRRTLQMIFQDPADSMNPRLTVGAIVEEPLVIQTKMSLKERQEKAVELLKSVGLSDEAYDRYPHQFSGGQRQRIAIARSLALDPKVILCDEPVSALDLSVQSQILNLLLKLQRERGLSLIFVSHDLSVVRHMSDRVAVMYFGSVVEVADSTDIYDTPLHPYTEALISAIPGANTSKDSSLTLQREVPSPHRLPPGCPYAANCPIAEAVCKREKPPLRAASESHFVACHLALKE